MATVLALSGSPSRTSRTALLAEHTAAGLRALGHRTHVLALRDLPAAPLLTADTHDASFARAVSLVAEADALVVATPIHKAAYSGLLKTFLDLLPQHAFAGKPVLPLATGGSPAHVLALDHTLRPVLTALGAQVAQGRFVLDRPWATTPDGAMASTTTTSGNWPASPTSSPALSRRPAPGRTRRGVPRAPDRRLTTTDRPAR